MENEGFWLVHRIKEPGRSRASLSGDSYADPFLGSMFMIPKKRTSPKGTTGESPGRAHAPLLKRQRLRKLEPKAKVAAQELRWILPRGSKYSIFKDARPQNHPLNGLWDQSP